jgi:DNA-binding PadR family transcriptional regulator
MTADGRNLLPLKPLVFEVLLVLSEGPCHGWSIVRDVRRQAGGRRALPANLLRTLRRMRADGLIEDAPRADPTRRDLRLTALGRTVARLEAARLYALVDDIRTRRLLQKEP